MSDSPPSDILIFPSDPMEKDEREMYMCHCDCLTYRLFSDGSVQCAKCGRWLDEARVIFANVPDEESPLASGVAPAREAGSAGGGTEVPKGRGFAPSVCSHVSFSDDDFLLFQKIASEKGWNPCKLMAGQMAEVLERLLCLEQVRVPQGTPQEMELQEEEFAQRSSVIQGWIAFWNEAIREPQRKDSIAGQISL